MRLPHRSAAARARATQPDHPDLQKLSDTELLAEVRGGDDLAFGELYNRHSAAVRGFCQRTYGNALDADDLAAETFFRVLQAVRRGTARIEHMRAYLYTVSRRVAMEWTSRRRDVPVDDAELTLRASPASDSTASSADRELITRAFTSLPERWRAVLWRVEVEGERPAMVAGQLGLSANATAALARRARDGLRAAYLQAHLADQEGPVTCRSVVEKLGAFTAGSVRGGEARRITDHLACCADCSALYAELAEVCAGLRVHASHLTPVVGLGTAFGGHALGWAGKFALLTGRVKIALAATAVAGMGAFGLATGPMLHGDLFGEHLAAQPDNGQSQEVVGVCTTCTPGTSGPYALPHQQQAPPPGTPQHRTAPPPDQGRSATDPTGDLSAGGGVVAQGGADDGARRSTGPSLEVSTQPRQTASGGASSQVSTGSAPASTSVDHDMTDTQTPSSSQHTFWPQAATPTPTVTPTP